MAKKTGLLLGLLAGGAIAHLAYQHLSKDQQSQLKDDVQDKLDDLKDRAVDYAFYASDAWDDFKDTFEDQSQHVSDKVKDVAGQIDTDKLKQAASAFGKRSDDEDSDLRSELADVSTSADDDSDDIVLNSEETFGGADVSGASEGEKPTETILPDGTSEPVEY